MKGLGLPTSLAVIAACATTQALQPNAPTRRCPAISPDQVRLFTSRSELDNLLETPGQSATPVYVVNGVPMELNSRATSWHSVATLTASRSATPVLFVNGIPVAGPEESVASLREKAATIGANGVLMAPASGEQSAVAVQYGDCTVPKGGTKTS